MAPSGKTRRLPLNRVARDLRFAWRQYRQRPAFGTVVLMTFALGIAATTVIASLAYPVLVRPLPYPHPEELAALVELHQKGYVRSTPFPNFADWRRQNTSFSELAAMATAAFTLEGRKAPEQLVGQKVTGGFFAVLSVRPFIGRWLTYDDDRKGAAPAAVISYSLWRRAFSADPRQIGQAVVLDGRTYSLVGVMPPDFVSFTDRLYGGGDLQPDVWTALATDEAQSPRGMPFLRVIGRLKRGVSVEAARSEMRLVGDRLAARYRAENGNFTIRMESVRDDQTAAFHSAVRLLFIAVGVLFFAACVNIANLLLVRSTARLREFALRIAVGADRRQLLSQSVAEGCALASAGSLLGIALAFAGLPLAKSVLPAGHIPWSLAEIEWPILLFTVGLSLMAGFMFGLVQALQAFRVNLNETLKAGGSASAGASRGRLQRALVVVQVSLAFVLVVGAALVLVSFERISRVNPGFDARKVVTARLYLPQDRFGKPEALASFYDGLFKRLSGLSDVEVAGGVLNLPMCGVRYTYDFKIEGRPDPVGTMNYTDYQVATPEYFAAMHIPLLRGRLFTGADGEHQRLVAVINQTMADRYWPAGDALGRRFQLDGDWCEIVGIVGGVEHTGLGDPVLCEAYLSELQHPWTQLMLAIRTRNDPKADVAEVRDALASLSAGMPPADVRPLESLVRQTLSDRASIVYLLDLFALSAVALAALGIYGTVAFTVARRTREIGIRIALGEPLGRVRGAILRQGFWLSAMGVLLGAASCLGLTRAVESQLFGIRAADPAVFAGGALLVFVLAAIACWFPARKATRIDPIAALRHE